MPAFAAHGDETARYQALTSGDASLGPRMDRASFIKLLLVLALTEETAKAP